MAWLRGSSGPAGHAAGAQGLATQPGDSTALREIFKDLIAYVLFLQATLEKRSPPFNEVRERVTRFIEDQERRVQAGEAPWESYREARFAVLAWVDEIILTSKWPHRAQWQHIMLGTHGTVNAGEEFYQRLEKLPAAARDVREIYYLCLELGFLGEHALADSASYLRDLRRGLYRQLSGAPNDIRQHYPRLFPEAYRKASGAARPAAPGIHPVWFGVALLVPVLLFLTYWLLLNRQTNRLLALLEKPVTVVVPAPPPPPAQPAKCATLIEALRCEGIQVQETARGIVVTLPGLLFEVNSAELNPQGAVKMGEVGRIVRKFAPDRVIAIEGHASRERGTPEERNQRLSDDRAKTAAGVLLGAGIGPEKISTRGFGSGRPVASNDTEDGRRQNRRVELIIERN
jgi:type VI secretion system protein ImpK